MHRSSTVAVLGSLVLLTTACRLPEISATASDSASPSTAVNADLAALEIAPEVEVDYERDEWQPSWRVLPGNDDHCDVREYSLKNEGIYVDADGTKHDHARVDEECTPYEPGDSELEGGHNEWRSPYDGQVTRDSSGLDADHFIPLEEVARSGGTEWSEEQKHEFAMYSPSVIVMVSAHSNRAKGSDDPADWMPSQDSYHCAYAARWVQLKADWDLTVDQDEHDALARVLADC